MLTWIEEVLHATEALHYFHVTCYISILGSPPAIEADKAPRRGNDRL